LGKAMIRRTFLKMAMLSPLAVLFKKKEPEGLTLDMLVRCKDELEKNDFQSEKIFRDNLEVNSVGMATVVFNCGCGNRIVFYREAKELDKGDVLLCSRCGQLEYLGVIVGKK